MKLVNFTIMPNEGTYRLKEITKEEFVEFVKKNKIESYISFKSTKDILEDLTKKEIELNKTRCYFNKDENYLAVVLRDGNKFRKTLTADDFKYYYCEYQTL